MSYSRATLRLGISASLILLAANAYALDFMGIPMGEPVSMVRCVDFKYDNAVEYMKPGYGTQPVKPCWLPDGDRRVRTIPADGPFVIWIHAAADKWPEGVVRTMGIVIDGKIESITAETRGAVAQESLFAGLSTKFGPPKKLEMVAFQNAFSATYQSIDAIWETGDATVNFRGFKDTLTLGYITANTYAGTAYLTEEAAAKIRAAPSF